MYLGHKTLSICSYLVESLGRALRERERCIQPGIRLVQQVQGEVRLKARSNKTHGGEISHVCLPKLRPCTTRQSLSKSKIDNMLLENSTSASTSSKVTDSYFLFSFTQMTHMHPLKHKRKIRCTKLCLWVCSAQQLRGEFTVFCSRRDLCSLSSAYHAVLNLSCTLLWPCYLKKKEVLTSLCVCEYGGQVWLSTTCDWACKNEGQLSWTLACFHDISFLPCFQPKALLGRVEGKLITRRIW